MLETIFQMVVTVICSILASSGLWTILAKKMDKKDNKTKLLLGLAHDRIMYIGMSYLTRGDWITEDEYENLHDFLYTPYHENGGNGSATKMMQTIDARLRMVPNGYHPDSEEHK